MSRRRMLVAAARYAARELAGVRAVRLEALPPATPRRTDAVVGAVAHGGLYLAAAAAVVGFFSSALGHGAWEGELRLAVGCVLAAEGALLTTNWLGARRLVLGRLHAREVARAGPTTSVVDALRWRLLAGAAVVLAFAALCGGLVLAALGAQDLL